jgi:hypothetical protein
MEELLSLPQVLESSFPARKNVCRCIVCVVDISVIIMTDDRCLDAATLSGFLSFWV